MTISSVQPDYSTILDDTLTIDLSNTITSSTETVVLSTTGSGYVIGTGISSGSWGAGVSSNTFTISNGGISTVGIGPLTTSDIHIQFPEEWKDCFPDWSRVQKMCEEYPGLKIAFDKFKNTYSLVKDDYDAPPNKKIRP